MLVKTEHKQQIFSVNHKQKVRTHAAFCVVRHGVKGQAGSATKEFKEV
jgi:hypothetical protein